MASPPSGAASRALLTACAASESGAASSRTCAAAPAVSPAAAASIGGDSTAQAAPATMAIAQTTALRSTLIPSPLPAGAAASPRYSRRRRLPRLDSVLLQLPIERGPPYPQPARHLTHATAAVSDGEA